MKRKELLVFQHVDVEHPGVFRRFLADDGIAWRVVELDQGEPIPALGDYAGLWVMGGPMDVWEEHRYPWLVDEKAAIRHAVGDLNMPFMGICLGHQLLADALGGEVGPGTPEVGVMNVELTEAGKKAPTLKAFPCTWDCLQWHSAEVLKAPAGSQILASSPACKVQALTVGDHAFSAQFHVEVTSTTIDDWSEIPVYRDALKNTLGESGAGEFKAQTIAGMAEFNVLARRLYDNWMSIAQFAC